MGVGTEPREKDAGDGKELNKAVSCSINDAKNIMHRRYGVEGLCGAAMQGFLLHIVSPLDSIFQFRLQPGRLKAPAHLPLLALSVERNGSDNNEIIGWVTRMQFVRGGKYGQPQDHVLRLVLCASSKMMLGCEFPNDVGLDTRCKFSNDAGLHTSQVESSSVRVLVALVKAERKRATTLKNVDEFLKKRKEQSDALFSQAKQEMEEDRKKLAEAD